jgi:hypothetical protein
MSLTKLLFISSSLLIFESAHAEIFAEEDLEAIDSSAVPSASFANEPCELNAAVGVVLERGSIDFPYGPPGLNNYKSRSGASGISLDLRKSDCVGRFPDAFGLVAAIMNNFPAGGRLYEVQAVSWSEMKISAFAQQNLLNLGRHTLAGVVESSLMYDRFQYPRGTYSFQYLQISAGLSHNYLTAVMNNDVAFGLDFAAAPILSGRILTKYDSAKSSSAVEATNVGLKVDGRVSGHDFLIGTRFGFSSNSKNGFAAGESRPQHEIGLQWVSRERFSSGFVVEKDPDGKVVFERDLKMKSAIWVVRWTESI